MVSSNRFSTLTSNKSDTTNKEAEDNVITTLDRDTTLSNQFSSFINISNDISVTNIREDSEKLSLKQTNNNIPKELITTLNVHGKKNVVTNSKRQKNISSNSKNSRNKNVSVITGYGVIYSTDSRTCSEQCHLTL